MPDADGAKNLRPTVATRKAAPIGHLRIALAGDRHLARVSSSAMILLPTTPSCLQISMSVLLAGTAPRAGAVVQLFSSSVDQSISPAPSKNG